MGFQSKQGFPFDLRRLICFFCGDNGAATRLQGTTSSLGYFAGTLSLSEQLNVLKQVIVRVDFRIYLYIVHSLGFSSSQIIHSYVNL